VSRTWVFTPPDQLTDRGGLLASLPAEATALVVVESVGWARSRKHHKQKLLTVFSNLRHFAEEQRSRGVEVRFHAGATSYSDALSEEVSKANGPIHMMDTAIREVRVELHPLVQSGAIKVVENDTWLTSHADFSDAMGQPPWRMDRFYRNVRKKSGLLMDGSKPVGGKYSFDADNRKPWKGSPSAPDPPQFDIDQVKTDAYNRVSREFADYPGEMQLEYVPATRSDAEAAWKWALDHAMPHFGPYEDAMSSQSRTLFHTLISALLNLGRLLPRQILDDVVAADFPLPTTEGFIRQVIGWREFVRHVHLATDGFRSMPPDYPEYPPNHLDANLPLPAAYWGRPSGLNCLDTVVGDVVETGYSHHITRLMILSNVATLLGVNPVELTDWFHDMYVDAWDWVVEPNVMGMGCFATAGLMTTKPYVSGAAYINKMSDYCEGCRFDPKTDCPVTHLYWRFLDQHQDRLSSNRRMSLPLASARKRAENHRSENAAIGDKVVDTLLSGDVVTPESLAAIRRGANQG